MTVEDALEFLVEVLNGQRAQLVEHAAHFDTLAGVRIVSNRGRRGPAVRRLRN
jgi:hypothetical protein